MKVAVIGAGLSGLAVTFYLLETGEFEVDLYDEKGIGAGASGISSGLVHPYPGEDARKSQFADEAIQETRKLLQQVSADFEEGIVRIPRDQQEREELRRALMQHPDVVETQEGFLIKSGMTVDVPDYLEKLWRVCEKEGASLHLQKIENLGQLAHYDQIVIATGAGTLFFPECKTVKIELIKGQLLVCSYPSSLKLPRSVIGKGYIAKEKKAGVCVLGSTYERGFTSDLPDLNKARDEILPKIASFFPEAKEFQVDGCRAGIRVSRIGHYLPYFQKLEDRVWISSAMGSRGLLYHAYAGKRVASDMMREALLSKS
jgi:glycine/D-amino acid oxidase-like deaminating enzyme